MSWRVLLHREFEAQFDELEVEVQDELLAHLKLLEVYGPTLGRPTVDTLKGSRFSNMKEFRLSVLGGVWRFAFAFDPERNAIVLIGGNKRGKNQKKFYKDLIKEADARFQSYCKELLEQPV